MPIPLSPSETFDLVVRSDQAVDGDGRPLADQPKDLPTFTFRHLSGREQRVMAGMIEAVEELTSSAVVIDKWFEILRFVLVGWRNLHDPRQGNQEISYDPDRLEDVLQYGEAHELVYRVFGYAPSAADLGNSASQSSSASAGSASPAAAESA